MSLRVGIGRVPLSCGLSGQVDYRRGVKGRWSEEASDETVGSDRNR